MSLGSAVPVLVGSLLVAAAAAQPAGGKFSLGGLVVNTRTGEPVNRARVHIIGYPAEKPAVTGDRFPARQMPPSSMVFTDASGRFRFEGLVGGNYSIRAEKPQFVPDGDTSRQMELTASMEDVRLKLAPLGVITGKVVDQNGEPLRGANVVALSTRIVDGLRQTNTDRNVSTDDRGMYRLWNMQPGKYLIKAAGWSGGTILYAGDTSPQFFADESFAPAYFGGGRSPDSATAILIEAGTEAHADVSVKLEPAFKIRGTLANFAPRRTVKFELLSGDEDVSAGRVSVNGDTGRFEVQYVASGSYILRATQDEAGAEFPVSVSGVDVNGVTLSLAGGVEVKGAIRVMNRPPGDTPSDGPLRRGIRSGCMVNLYPAHGRSGQTYRSRAGEGDQISVPGVMPGLYRVNPQCFGAYVQSVSSGTQDLLANPLLMVPPGEAPPPIEVVAKHGGGRIHGEVASGPTVKQSHIDVLLVPQFPGSTGPVLVRAYEQGVNGCLEFYFEALAPGPYIAYAFLDGEDIEYRNPQALRSLTGGVSVQVEDGSNKEIGITDVIR